MPVATHVSAADISRPVKRQKIEAAEDEEAMLNEASGSSPRRRPRPVPAVDDDEAALVEEQMSLPFEYTKEYEQELDYRNKLVLAPMVRTGSCEWKAMRVADSSADGMFHDLQR